MRVERLERASAERKRGKAK